MSTNKKNKFSICVYLVITIIGCVLVSSSIVPSEYLKLVIVIGPITVGMYGIVRGFSTSSIAKEVPIDEE